MAPVSYLLLSNPAKGVNKSSLLSRLEPISLDKSISAVQYTHNGPHHHQLHRENSQQGENIDTDTEGSVNFYDYNPTPDRDEDAGDS